MSITSELKRCPKCGGPIPLEAPKGLCPKCLFLQASLQTEAEKSTASKSPAPTQEELSAAFPQLEILELIGQGGMGFVFKARQPKLERLVALKILPQSLAADPAFAERFAREGRTLARLNHPNIVTIHDFGQANGFFYLLMEFVDGVNLRQAMKVGRFTPDQALAVVPKICDALQFAHNEGILHRDIKPENILLDAKGRVKIADFGIAKIVGTENREAVSEPIETVQQTNLTGIIGTPRYMAPEQLEHPQQVDQRADIYSLGVVFYEMLTGELPLGRFAPPSEKSSADPRLDEVVLRALEKEPNRRTQSAGEVKTQVETIARRSRKPSMLNPGERTEKVMDGVRTSLSFQALGPHLFRGVVAGFLIFLIIFAGAIIVSNILPKAYMSTARVEVGPFGAGPYDPFRIETEIQTIRSPDLLRQVAASLDLTQRWGDKYRTGAALNDEAVVLLLQKELDIRQSRNTSLLELNFYSDSANEAAEIANKIAELYCALPPGQRGNIIDRAKPASRPVRPNIPLNISLGALAGAMIGILTSICVSLFSFLRRNQSATNAAQISELRNSAAETHTTTSKPFNLPTRPPGSLILVATLFILGGFYSIWNVADSLAHRTYPIHPGVLALPIGIGLLRFRRGWRSTALAALWLHFALLLFGSAMILGWIGEVSPDAGILGKVFTGRSRTLIALFCYLNSFALLFWMFWVLTRPKIKTLFQQRRITRPWIEWATLSIAFLAAFVMSKRQLPLMPTNNSPNTSTKTQVPPAATPLLVAAARKGDFGVYIHSLGTVESSNSVAFNISEDYIHEVVKRLDSGQKLSVDARDRRDKVFGHGYLLAVDNQIDATTGTIKCRASLVPEGDNLMISGLFLNIRVLLEMKHEVISIPAKAIPGDRGGEFVWVIKPDQTATQRHVKTLGFEGEIAGIQQGLSPGELVVIEGQEALKEGLSIPRNIVREYDYAKSARASENSSPNQDQLLIHEPPQLRFLTWQPPSKESRIAVFRPDGTEMQDEAELRMFRAILAPPRIDVSQANWADRNPRFLNLWFFHPLFDQHTVGEVSLLDATGQSLPSNLIRGMGGHRQTGWLTDTIYVGEGEELTRAITVRLRYTVGPLENQKGIDPRVNGSYGLEQGVQVNGIGQDVQGKAFIAIAMEGQKDPARKFGTFVILKRGNELEPIGGETGGYGEGSTGVWIERFVFDVPLKDVVQFHVGTRPVHTMEWKDVVFPEIPK